MKKLFLACGVIVLGAMGAELKQPAFRMTEPELLDDLPQLLALLKEFPREDRLAGSIIRLATRAFEADDAKVTVVKAEYGYFGPDTVTGPDGKPVARPVVNVMDMVCSLVASGSRSIISSNRLAGRGGFARDPAPGKAKELHLSYRVGDGPEISSVIRENDEMHLTGLRLPEAVAKPIIAAAQAANGEEAAVLVRILNTLYRRGFVPGAWIGDGLPDRDGADWYEEDPAPEFKATVTLPEGMREITVHFTCAGFGCFRVGNQTVMCEDGLDTLWTPYDKTVYEKTITVKTESRTCDIVVRLGNGFYNLPPLRFWGSRHFREVLAHGRPCFKMAIDGVEKPLEWKWRKTNVVRNSVYLGTEIDATRPEDTEWKPVAVVKGPNGMIRSWPEMDMCVDGVQAGTARWLKEGEVQIVDFGVNASGVPEFTFKNEARGMRIEIVYGERLNADGSVNVLTQTAGQIKRGNGGPGAPHVACQRDAYICGGVACERFSPPFTWHIFRYAEIRGAKHLLGMDDAKRTVRSMISLDEKAPAAKAFKTDNKDLVAIHEMCRRTFQANLIGGVQSDCPGRERLGYGGDIVSTYEAYMLNWDMRAIYLKILQDFVDEASDDGWITETAPYVGIAVKGEGGRSGPVSWVLAVPELIDGLLCHYNETKALDYYPVCTRYIRQLAAKHPDGLIPQCIGDHEALERAPNDVTATAHWHRFVALTAGFAKRLGRTEDVTEFEALAAKIKAAFAAKYVKDGVVANGTQSAQAIGLYLGLVPPDQIPTAERRLVKAVEEKGYGPTTGIFSTRYMLMYLSEHGRVDIARKIVLHKGFPGWLHMLERGATTLWETWKESDNVYSNCHPMFGSVDEWILRFGK